MNHNHHHQHLIPSGASLAILALITLIYLFYHYKNIKRWNRYKTISFVAGAGLLGIALLPSTLNWAHTDFRGHMVLHLLIGMYAPVFLVLGAPVSLILISVKANTARSIMNLLKSRLFIFLSHPVTALILNIGGMFLLYLTPLYKISVNNSFLHIVIHIHFLMAGFLYTWSLIGIDPVPKRPSFKLRLIVLFTGIALHAYLSKLMYARVFPYDTLYSNEQIREAAKLMYYWGDLSELIILIVLFTIWYRSRNHSGMDFHPFFSQAES